ncbi:hypothetical protein [Paeniglutamicibacter antarcticus]|uniref:Uncharacterized protein n=1 Tax=Paeniglutamicibacter antarcticus TaxID=494023 RepID=A0ABP9TFS0_9MICC
MSDKTEQGNSKNEPTKPKDSVSDPALGAETGHDWSDEGGATPGGPATNVDPDKESAE